MKSWRRRAFPAIPRLVSTCCSTPQAWACTQTPGKVLYRALCCPAAVFDAVYNPAQTELLRLAGQAGAKTIGGMEMLVYQAVAAHEIWYGSRFRQEDIALLCQDAQEELSRIFPGKETEKGRGAQ